MPPMPWFNISVTPIDEVVFRGPAKTPEHALYEYFKRECNLSFDEFSTLISKPSYGQFSVNGKPYIYNIRTTPSRVRIPAA